MTHASSDLASALNAQQSQPVWLSDKQIAARYSAHRSTAPWRWIKERGFPKGVQFSPNCTRWRLSDVEAWEQSQGGAA